MKLSVEWSKGSRVTISMSRLKITNEVGKTGEDVACRFLMKQGYKVKDRNYLKKWGEIDIVAEKKGTVHFLEVKTVSCESFPNVSGVTDDYRPEDNIHPWKLKKMGRVIQSYLLERYDDDEPDWQFDVVAVYLNSATRTARVNMMEDIIL